VSGSRVGRRGGFRRGERKEGFAQRTRRTQRGSEGLKRSEVVSIRRLPDLTGVADSAGSGGMQGNGQ